MISENKFLNISKRRIEKEYDDLIMKQFQNCIVGPINKNNLYEWSATLIGPEDSPYAEANFDLKIEFQINHPMEPPKITFVTPIYHPNIDEKGAISINIFKHQWSPNLAIRNVLQGVYSLFTNPDLDDPLMLEIADLYKNDYEGFYKIAKEQCEKYIK